MSRFAAFVGAAALGLMLAFAPATREATAQTIGQPIRLHSADQRVNVVTDGIQELKQQAGTAVAALAPSADLPRGGFVVTWMSPSQPGISDGVFARRFASDGTPLDATDIPVSAQTSFYHLDPTVTGRPDGSFVVTWMSESQDGTIRGVFARRFAADGTALDASDIAVNATTATVGEKKFPAIAARLDGSFIVAWVSSGGQDGGGWTGIYARRFASDGTPLDDFDILVNATTAGNQGFPALAARPDNSFVVTWISNDQDGSGAGIFARRFAADGSPLDAADIPVNSYVAGDQVHPAVAVRRDGGFLVSWRSDGQDGSSAGIFARRFASDGNPLDATDIPVNSYTMGPQLHPALTVRPDGSFVVTWWSRAQDGGSDVIFARRFAADGTALDAADFLATSTPDGVTLAPSIAALADGETVVITWMGRGPGDDRGIFMNRLRVGGTPIARDDAATVNQPGTTVINVLANDADPDVGDTLTVVDISATANGGSVVINGDNTLTYTPPAGCGLASDSFTYTIRDSTGKEATATVSVTITQIPLMSVTPAMGLRLYGQQGGPFPPPHGMYTVTNSGCAEMNWDVRRNAYWLTGVPASGTLAPNASTLVTLKASRHAPALPVAAHRGLVRFVNLSNGMGTTDLIVILTVLDAFGTNGFETARLLSGAAGTTWGSNVGGTGQAGEPNHGGVSLPLASVWWSWTAPSSGRVVFHTSGSSFDTVLAVYTGTAINALSLVAANDDDPTLAPRSRVGFDAVAGTTYRIVVDGKGDATGQIRLNWSLR